jgi:hypothetical protein
MYHGREREHEVWFVVETMLISGGVRGRHLPLPLPLTPTLALTLTLTLTLSLEGMEGVGWGGRKGEEGGHHRS